MKENHQSHRRIRIAFAWNYVDWGGAQMYFLGLARRLRERAEFEFWMPEGTDRTFLGMCEAEGIPCRFFKHSVSTSLPRSMMGKLKRHCTKVRSEMEMIARLSNGRYDVVHVELGPWQSLLALTGLALQVPVFHTIHNRLPDVSGLRALSWKLKFRTAGMCGNLHAFAANVDARDSVEAYSGSAYRSKVVVTHAFVNPDELRCVDSSDRAKERARRNLKVPQGAFLILTVAQFIDRKGRWLLLRAALQIRERFPSCAFRWITASDVSREDREMISSYGLDDAFQLMTMSDLNLDRKGLLETVSSADVFVLPSYVEGLPIAMMEAMGLGVTVVATDINGIPEAIRNGENDLLVNPGDADGLSEAIIKIAGDDEERARIGGAAREILQSELTEAAVAAVAWRQYQEASS